MSRGGGLITAIVAIFAALFIGWLTLPSGMDGTEPLRDARLELARAGLCLIHHPLEHRAAGIP